MPLLAHSPLLGTGFTRLPIELPECCNKQQNIGTVRTEVIRGNSRINGNIYQRGSVADYNH